MVMDLAAFDGMVVLYNLGKKGQEDGLFSGGDGDVPSVAFEAGDFFQEAV